MEGNKRRNATVWLMALLVTTATSLFAGAAAAPRAHAAANAQVTSYPTPTASSTPQLMVLGPDGNLWFSEYTANQIARITTSGVITEFTMPTSNSGPFGIAAGPDGNLWFTEYNVNQIGRITTAGAVTEFPIPTSGSGPNGITLGPDGNLWFTEFSTDKIASITTSGTVTEHALPNSGTGPNLITAGPDGNLWFTEFYPNAIGRMTTAGSVAEFPTLGVGPSGIAAGPDGNIWFTEYYSAAIGRISTAGTGVAEFPTPTPYSVPYGIAVGSNGALWFAENSGGRVAQITTTGVTTEFVTPAGSQPFAVAPGADGNMWFTDASSNNAIDRLQIQSPCLDLHVRATPNPVQPAASEAIGITLANCGPAGVSGLTTSTTVTPPSGCSAAPAIPDVTGDLAAGSSAAGGASFTTPTASACFGTYAVSTQTTQASVVVASATGSYAVTPCLTLHVTATPPTVDPGGSESVGISLANCGSIGLSGLTTSTTATPPAGCGAAPAIPDITGDLAAGASTTGGGSFTAPTCLGTYALSTQTVQGSNVLASTTASYSVSLVAEYPTAGRPVGITSGSDGNLWFAANDATVDSIDSAGHITPYPIPNNLFNAFRITWGPDGALWMTTNPTGVMRMTTTGRFSEFAMPGDDIRGITTGPDGNLWITDGQNNRIGRMTTAGSITWFAAPIGLSLDQIVAGSDGALWFAASTAIGRITTSGIVTLYQLAAGAGASEIALGPDGNMWYTDPLRSVVGRVTPGGVIAEFPTPTQPSRPAPISEAADGGVWFGETSVAAFDESGVGRAAPDGTMTEQPLTMQPANPQYGVAAGPDGNVWVTEYYGDAIARIKLTTPNTCTPLTASASSVRHAAPQLLRATIANCSNTPQVMSLTTNITSKSGCSTPSTVSTSVPLQPFVKTVVSDTFKAPRCKGSYTATMTLSAGGTVLGTTTVTYKVT